MKKREETARGGTALVTTLGMAVHRQGVAVPPNRVVVHRHGRHHAAGGKGAPDITMCTALVTTMGWWCTGQGVAVPLP
jgi:hypothetical protein